MNFYHIKDSYVRFLQKYDSRIPDNKQELRPYIGIVLAVGDVHYYAPLTSPKQKHLRMKNQKDFRKIGAGKLGAINFNNMIPVPQSALIPIHFDRIPDPKYRRLLQNQYAALLTDWLAVEKTAFGLHTLLFSDESTLTPFERTIKKRCCDLPLLESVYQNWSDA